MSSSDDSGNQKNTYMEQVQEQQRQVMNDLRAVKRKMPMEAPMAARAQMAMNAAPAPQAAGGSRERRVLPQEELPSAAVEIRITGWWRWQTVIVPPNAYVVHRRAGAAEPLHLGLGISFPYNPYTDSFLVVPGAMQTILINAYCICKELQGLLVQGYVQWIIADFATAYKKLDFSDVDDPMKVVNVQLREQAEAAIKDKVATMGIDAVLSDKQPIIQELTARLRAVAEGEGHGDKGLGLRIVTVQVKEAVVSSKNLWENLQKPFRSEREQVARLAEMQANAEISAREMAHNKAQESNELATQGELAKLRAAQEAEAFDREQNEAARRQQREQEVARQTQVETQRTQLQAEKAKREVEQAQVENARLLAEARRQAKHQELLREVELTVAESARRAEEAQAQLALEQARFEATAALEKLKQAEALAAKKRALDAELVHKEAQLLHQQKELEVTLHEADARQRIAASVTPGQNQAALIKQLPEIASKLPQPKELKSVQFSGDAASGAGALGTMVGQVLSVVQALKSE